MKYVRLTYTNKSDFALPQLILLPYLKDVDDFVALLFVAYFQSEKLILAIEAAILIQSASSCNKTKK